MAMNMRNGARAPLRLLVLFILMTVIPLAVLGWAGWRMLQDDLARETRQLQDRVDDTATLAVGKVDRALSTWEDRLVAVVQGDPTGIPPGATVLVLNSRGVLAHHGKALPYYPQVAPLDEAFEEVFEVAETREARGDLTKASSLYSALAYTEDRVIRAGALMRLARSLSGQHRFDEALKTYAELAVHGGIPVSGDPAELVARERRIALFSTIGDRNSQRQEAKLLAAVLSEGRYPIDRATFDFYSRSTEEVTTDTAPLVEVVQAFWPKWQEQTKGRTSWTSGDAGEFVTVWRQTPVGTAALVGKLDTLMAPVTTAVEDLNFRLALEEPSGQVSSGTFFADGLEARQSLEQTGLPWILRISADRHLMGLVPTTRRNVLAASFGLMALVISAASYFVFRALTREFRVAQLQSDFVSAVSHEFRTPLTAMRHLTDLLEEGDVSADRLPSYYGALGKETRRLHSMVESLLDFARMESGRRSYEMTETNAVEFAETLVDEFREQRRLPPHRLELRPPKSQPQIRADRDALTLAIRNLLDNAIKYSPDTSTVSVSVDSQDGFASIAVEDRGMGIGSREQTEIFEKFVRGTAAKMLNVKGTGIGLTMAHQIVKAHGGRIELNTHPERGSRFTIMLPLAAGASSENGIHA